MKARTQRNSPAFTVLELMIAISILGIIVFAMYSTWTAILRGTKSGQDAAARVQRARIAIRCLEDALLTARFFGGGNAHFYSFEAYNDGDFASLSLVSRIHESFPGWGMFGDQPVRRISFYIVSGKDGDKQLMMTQMPVLLATNASQEPYSLVLAREVNRFNLEFWDDRLKEWTDEWLNTNALPTGVRIAVGLGDAKRHSAASDEEVFTRLVSLPGIVVPPQWQGGMSPGPMRPPLPGETNRFRPNPLDPNRRFQPNPNYPPVRPGAPPIRPPVYPR